MLSGYQYSIVHRPGTKQGNADGLSRLPLPTAQKEVPQPQETVLLLERLDSSATSKDPVLAKVRKCVLQGWPDSFDGKALDPYSVWNESVCYGEQE